MKRPLVSIGIPTYNRARYLGDSLRAALAQTYADVEIIVTDNASTDDTARIVEQLGRGRVIYHRHETNQGAIVNFLKALELARGDYFFWLQDDDLVFHDYVQRAVDALSGRPMATAFLAYSFYSSCIRTMCQPTLFGPPVALNWSCDEVKTIAGDLVVPLSLLMSVAIPPMIIFQTAHLRRHVGQLADARLPLYAERTLLAAVAQGRDVVVAPFVGGVYRRHENQYSLLEICKSKVVQTKAQWIVMASVLEELCEDMRGDCQDSLLEVFGAVGPEVLLGWLRQSDEWPSSNSLCVAVRDLVRKAAKDRLLIARPVRPSLHTRVYRAGKRILRMCAPPLFYHGSSRMLRALSAKK